MPLPPIEPNATDRTFVDYQNAIAVHTLMVRTPAPLSYTAIGDVIKAFLLQIGPLMHATTVIRTRYAPANGIVSYPVDMGMDGFVFGSGTANQETNATAITFVGRTDTGRRARVSVFGFKAGLSAYRLTTAESTEVAGAISVITQNEGIFVAVDNNEARWGSYADIKASDYWVRRARG